MSVLLTTWSGSHVILRDDLCAGSPRGLVVRFEMNQHTSGSTNTSKPVTLG